MIKHKADPSWWDGSHMPMAVPAAELLSVFDDLLKIQCGDGNWNLDPYMHGMANGMILMRSLVSGEHPDFLEAPQEWSSERHAATTQTRYHAGFEAGKRQAEKLLRDLKASAQLPKPTKAMVEFFKQRTKEHINRVRKYLHKLDGAGDFTVADLDARGKQHDADKYSKAKVLPYLWVTEYYRVKNSGEEVPAELKEIYSLTRAATGDHITINRHHPEAHSDPNAMTDLDLAEMVADWSAMSEELGEGSARGWADKKVGSKWKFDLKHTELIYHFIDHLEGKTTRLKAGFLLRGAKKGTPVEEAIDLVNTLTLSGGNWPNMRLPSEEALAILQETVREPSLKLYRGIRLTPPSHPSLMGPDKDEWVGMPPSLFDAALDLRPGDRAPGWLRKEGNDFASTSKSEKIARRYMKEGHLQILLSATVARNSILVDLSNFKKVVVKHGGGDLLDTDRPYGSSEREVIVVEPIQWIVEDVHDAHPRWWKRLKTSARKRSDHGR